MAISKVLGGLALAATAVAQVANYQNSGHAISLNIPSDTASSGSGPIYFQISAPSGTQWVGFGQGSRMSGSTMFVVYSRDSTNVTLSGRAGTGHSMPQHDDSIQLTLLEGSGIASDGSMVANVRCDSCSSSSSNWIYASKSGDPLDTDDVSTSISQHNADTSFSLDLSSATGGSSTNPFFTSTSTDTSSDSSSSSSASAPSASNESASSVSQTAAATGTRSASSGTSPTNAVSNPLASTGATSSDSTSQERANPNSTLLSSHGIIMSLLFVGLFPLFSLALYLPTNKRVRFIHAPLQILSLILLIVGLALGIVLGQRIGELDGYHMIIGFIVTFSLIIFQPAMGLYQHLTYHKTGQSTLFGTAHRWLGRTMIILGIVNGGLGWNLSGSQGAYLPYGIVAGLVFLVYISVLLFAWHRGGSIGGAGGKGADGSSSEDEKSGRAFEMQNKRASRHRRLTSDETNGNAYAEQQQRGTSGGQTNVLYK